MLPCPCGLGPSLVACCGMYLSHQIQPATPEALMRARYSAYTLANLCYIKETMRGKPLNDFDEQSAEGWSRSVLWLGLQILNTKTILY